MRSRAELERLVKQAGFTPRVADAPALVELLAGDAEADPWIGPVARALGRLGDVGARSLLARLPTAAPDHRVRIVRVLARKEGAWARADVREALVARLDDVDPRVRRAAATALGKLGARDAEDALLQRLATRRGAERHELALALGKLGGERALAALRALDTGDDARLQTIVERASLMLERTLGRGTPSEIDPDAVAPEPLSVVFRCRKGLAPILAEELAEKLPSLSPRIDSADAVAARFAGPLGAAFAARTFLRFGFVLPPEPVPDGDDVATALTRALVSDAAFRILSTFTRGAIRYRIEWAAGGHRRRVVWRVARDVARARPALRNDPTRTTWVAVVHERARSLSVELVPHRLADPRFAYRRGDVPAASHPTLAAALARIADTRADDVVWDPFCGSGTELVERALAGPAAAILGTDRDPAALAVARVNLQAAGVPVVLARADALAFAPRGVTLVLTNPPMGRRVLRGPELGPLLERFVAHAARVLSPGGRLAWYSPLPARTAAAARHAGLALVRRLSVDMGGFAAELSLWRKV